MATRIPLVMNAGQVEQLQSADALALGTPASGTLTNCTGLPISTGVSGLAAGVATWLVTPSSTNLRTVMTDETGNGGGLVFANNATMNTLTVSASLTVSTPGNYGINITDTTNTGSNFIRWLDSSGYVADMLQYSTAHATLANRWVHNNGGGFYWTVGGVSVLAINGSGQIGIRNATPGAVDLHVGADNTIGKIYIAGDSSGSSPVSTGRPTNPGQLIIGRSGSSDYGGVEWILSGSGSGYGFKTTAPDADSRQDLRWFGRSNSATWSELMSLSAGGKLSIGTSTHTGLVTIGAGTTSVAPFVILAGTNLTSAVSGALENDGKSLYYTDNGPTRFPISITENKNILINGDFDIWQRGTSFSVSTSTFAADRWTSVSNGGGVVTTSRSTDVPTQSQSSHLSTYSLKVLVTTNDASLAGTERYDMRYALEGTNFRGLVGRDCYLSFWVKSSVTGTYCVTFGNGGGDRSYVVEYTISSADTWEYKTVAIKFDYSGGTWTYDGSGIGLLIYFPLAAVLTGTAGSWQSSNVRATTNQVNFMTSNNNAFYLSQVKLELGRVPTKYPHEDISETLAKCQRYYEKSYSQGTDPQTATDQGSIRYFAGNTAGEFTISYAVEKAKVPTIVFYSTTSGVGDTIRDVTGAANRTAVSQDAGTHNTGLVISPATTTAGNLLRVQFTADVGY